MKSYQVAFLLLLVCIITNCQVDIPTSPVPTPTSFPEPILLTKLLAADRAASDYFGYSVALSGDGNTALVGAYQDDDKGSNAGSVYIYRLIASIGAWEIDAKLVASDGAADDNFGISVALSGDGNVALVGSPGDDTSSTVTNSGSVYIYRRGNSDNPWV